MRSRRGAPAARLRRAAANRASRRSYGDKTWCTRTFCGTLDGDERCGYDARDRLDATLRPRSRGGAPRLPSICRSVARCAGSKLGAGGSLSKRLQVEKKAGRSGWDAIKWRRRLYEDMNIEIARANYRMLMERTLPPRMGG